MRNTGIEFTESELNNSLFCSSLERVLNLYVHVYKQTNLVKHRRNTMESHNLWWITLIYEGNYRLGSAYCV